MRFRTNPWLGVSLLFAGCYATHLEGYVSPRHHASKAEVIPKQTIERVREHQGFADLRYEVLSMIGGATKRVWVSTPFLTDGEIATSLFMAKYRKLDVKVLLGKQKANAYLSRLSFLTTQNVPVFLFSNDFKHAYQTSVLVDDRLVVTNGELNVKAEKFKFVSRETTDSQTQQYIKDFQEAFNQKIPAIPTPTPNVGRPGQFNNAYGSTTPTVSHIRSETRRPVERSPTYGADGAYIYDRKSEPAPEGMPRSLPKQTIQQKKLLEQFKESNN